MKVDAVTALRGVARSRANLDVGNDIRWRGKLTCPQIAHPLARELFRLLNKEMVLIQEVSTRSGVARSTIEGWRDTCNPTVGNLEAVLNVLGYKLKIVKAK